MDNGIPRLNILLVENMTGHTTLVCDALERSKNKCQLHTVSTSQNTLSYLRGDKPYASAPTPDLVLFDMSDANSSRLKLLDQVHADTSRRNIPMVLLTSPDSEKLVEETYGEQDGCVMFSPIELDNFLHTMRSRQPGRFLNAVGMIQKLGFVLVRVPAEFMNLEASKTVASAH